MIDQVQWYPFLFQAFLHFHPYFSTNCLLTRNLLPKNTMICSIAIFHSLHLLAIGLFIPICELKEEEKEQIIIAIHYY